MSNRFHHSFGRKRGYQLATFYAAAIVALTLLIFGAGVVTVILCSVFAALITYAIVNAPARYRRHGLGQINQAVDHRMGIFGKSYPEDPVGPSESEVGRNSPCPCGSGKKYKRCCGSS